MKFNAFASVALFVASVSSFPTNHLEMARGYGTHPATGTKDVKGYKRDSAVAELAHRFATHPKTVNHDPKGYKRDAADEAFELHYKRNLQSDPSASSFAAEVEVAERSAVEEKREPGCDE